MIEFVKMNDVGIPQVNQIEINPWNQRVADLEWHKKYNVQAEAWAPFAEGRHDLFTNPVLSEIGHRRRLNHLWQPVSHLQNPVSFSVR